jgi:glycosyltransferase involved in cell wall biosynthesis
MLKVHRLLRTVGKMINIYVALSEFSRQKFVACGLPAERTTTKPNFVYPDPEARTRPGEYALFVGRLSPEKGLLTLLTSWTRMGARVPLAIVGDGPLASRLLSEVQARSLNHVSLRGRLARADTYQAIKSAGFLILPSECYENFPMSVVEAFACGVPVICSRAGAMQEIVADGRTGLHFTPGDADDLAKKVEWAWTHRAEMAAMGRAARAEYEAKYTAERNYAMLMDIYQRAANSKALSPC